MGNWAHSLQVKCDDADAVAELISEHLIAKGYEILARDGVRSESESEKDDDLDQSDFDEGDVDADQADEEPGIRRIRVLRPHRGWVGILDADMGDEQMLAQMLSSKLATDTLQVLVNDSDAWLYEIRRNGQLTDEFDSSGGATDDAGDITPEIQAAMDRGDEDEVARLMGDEMMKHVPKGPIVMPFGKLAPSPEMTMLRDRVKDGKASFWERLRYRWMIAKWIFGLIIGFRKLRKQGFGFDIPQGSPPSEDELRRHAARIRDIFPGASEKALMKLLPQSRFPAEGLLEEFLGIVGLPTSYANLNYDYWADFSTRELAGEGIVQTRHMQFKASGIRGS